MNTFIYLTFLHAVCEIWQLSVGRSWMSNCVFVIYHFDIRHNRNHVAYEKNMAAIIAIQFLVVVYVFIYWVRFRWSILSHIQLVEFVNKQKIEIKQLCWLLLLSFHFCFAQNLYWIYVYIVVIRDKHLSIWGFFFLFFFWYRYIFNRIFDIQIDRQTDGRTQWERENTNTFRFQIDTY